MKIAFITDLHLPKRGTLAKGIDTYQHFDNILEDVAIRQIDSIIIGGDLSLREPHQAVNQYVKRKLDQIAIPYTIIPGNHDDPSQLLETFDYPEIIDSEIYYVKQLGEDKVICLDSSSKQIGDSQLAFLEKSLRDYPEINLIIIHHPILKANVPYMDINHALVDQVDIQAILKEVPRNFYIFSGHYHVEKTIIQDNITQFITPSLYIQISQEKEEFEIDHTIPGYRLIEIGAGAELYTWVRYLV